MLSEMEWYISIKIVQKFHFQQMAILLSNDEDGTWTLHFYRSELVRNINLGTVIIYGGEWHSWRQIKIFWSNH